MAATRKQSHPSPTHSALHTGASAGTLAAPATTARDRPAARSAMTTAAAEIPGGGGGGTCATGKGAPPPLPPPAAGGSLGRGGVVGRGREGAGTAGLANNGVYCNVLIHGRRMGGLHHRGR